MGKSLVIAEKPSVGRDIAKVLPGPFEKHEGYLEGPQHVVTWAVGHLVQLAEPEEYDPKFKRWRMADLPILPKRFKLVVRDERSKKQFKVVRQLLHREDIEEVINACDAGREGELIFAYLYEQAKATKPVKRLWLSSMTPTAIKEAFANLRPGSDLARLEQAARSRSEADWIVGMNATRAATIRLRSSFDGAVSLGRVQTPTLAIVVRREQEIRDFKPKPYWLIDATFGLLEGDLDRSYLGRYHLPAKGRRAEEEDDQGVGRGERVASEEQARAVVEACKGREGQITKLERREVKEAPPLLYDLTTLQREANTRYGFSARRTLAAAQRLYEEHKAITYPRTNSRYLSGDMVAEIKPVAELLAAHSAYAKGAKYVLGLDLLPLGRVVNDARVSDHHAIIPTNSPHKLEKMSEDERRVFDLVARRFLAVFHPEARYEQTRVETVVAEHLFRSSGRVVIEPGWRALYDQHKEGGAQEEEREEERLLPPLAQGERVRAEDLSVSRKETKPPRRYTDASLLAAMETAGKLVEDEELREAMKDSGIGTPATRAAIIERLIEVGYLERDGRTLVPTEKGMNVIKLLESHALTSPEMTGDWERRLAAIEQGSDSRERFMADIAEFTKKTVDDLDRKLNGVRIPRARLGPCPVCGREIVENRKGFSCWSPDDPGCGFVIWKSKSGKQLSAAIAKELIKHGRTKQQVSGFRSRSGRSFRARLALCQDAEGRWRVEFDEPWAREGAKPPEEEPQELPAATAA